MSFGKLNLYDNDTAESDASDNRGILRELTIFHQTCHILK